MTDLHVVVPSDPPVLTDDAARVLLRILRNADEARRKGDAAIDAARVDAR